MKNQFQQAKWADFEEGQLKSTEGEQPLQMQHSDGTALPLVLDESSTNKFGADVIRFPAGKGVGLPTSAISTTVSLAFELHYSSFSSHK